MIFCEIIQEMDGSTGSLHLFEELGMPDDDEFEADRNCTRDSYEMCNLLQLDGVNGVGKLVGAAVACTQDGANGVGDGKLIGAAIAH